MTKTDANGNTVSLNRKYCMNEIRTKKVNSQDDAANRVMVNLSDGGTIWFFKYDEPTLTRKLGFSFRQYKR